MNTILAAGGRIGLTRGAGCRLLLAGAVLGLCGASAHAQIAYARITGENASNVHIVNADGSGDTALNLQFPKVGAPVWSHDGVLLGVSATDPAHASELSLTIFSVNVASGAVQQVTNFHDQLNQNGYTVTYALYKAYSPDRKTMVVNSTIVQGGTPNGAQSFTPILQLFPSNGDPGPTATLHVGFNRDNVHHDGDGCDWSPAQNVVAAPFKWDAPLNSGLDATYGKAEATAIYLIDPNTANNERLTTPHGDVIFSGSFVSGTWAEEDYAPKFSPNGGAVAYVRSYQQTNSGSGPDFDIQALRMIDLGSRQDREVLRFQKGLYCQAVDWSADGTQLVFDLGQQVSSSGFPVQQADVQTLTVNVVNLDGSNPHQVVGAAAGGPSWRAGANTRPALLANISTRMGVGTGDNALIGGFIITGFEPKKLIIRGIGPSLAARGVGNALANPVLELYQGNNLVISNDDWQQAPNTNEIPNGFAPSDARESVIVTTLNPGAYTAKVRGANGETGAGLVEAYDLSANTSSVANISTRGAVNTGDDVMIGGFFVGAGGNSRIIIRAIGPSLAGQGVQGALQNPTLDVRDGNGTPLAFNDDWQSDPNANQVQSAGVAPQDSRESAISTILGPGSYTAIVRGKDNATGVGLVEVYNLP